MFQHTAARRRLRRRVYARACWWWFQHTAARRRLLSARPILIKSDIVSTHSRPKAAARYQQMLNELLVVSTHSRPKAAAGIFYFLLDAEKVSTHSRPKAAAYQWLISAMSVEVSTHSRPKAAAAEERRDYQAINCFNTQPPEGGCSLHKKTRKISALNTVFR